MILSDDLRISVVIATKDRAAALRDISLPSLLKQDTDHFDVVVWDASGDDGSRDVVEQFVPRFAERGIECRYFRAPRAGLTSQRNDSLAEARGDVIFFIDDDSRVSIDGVRSLEVLFGSVPWLMAGALPIIDVPASVIAAKRRRGIIYRLVRFVMRKIRETGSYSRTILSSATIYRPQKDLPGYAEWLTGLSMAYRREVFDEMKFDERLQRFGGYALSEDIDMSHRVFLRWDRPLLVAQSGTVFHEPAPGGRLDRVRMIAANLYNLDVVRDNFNKLGGGYGALSYIFGTRIMGFFGHLVFGNSPVSIVKGYLMYRKAKREDAMKEAVPPPRRTRLIPIQI